MHEQLDLLLEKLKEKLAVDVTFYDVTGKSSLCDYVVIASSMNERHLTALTQEIQMSAKELEVELLNVIGKADSGWVLLDGGYFIIHLFTPQMRTYYDLERLYRD